MSLWQLLESRPPVPTGAEHEASGTDALHLRTRCTHTCTHTSTHVYTCTHTHTQALRRVVPAARGGRVGAEREHLSARGAARPPPARGRPRPLPAPSIYIARRLCPYWAAPAGQAPQAGSRRHCGGPCGASAAAPPVGVAP